MKSTKTILLLSAFICSFVYFGCSKSEDTPAKPIDPNTIPDSRICDGNGQNTYYPMDSLDLWNYTFKVSGNTQGIVPSLKITGHYAFDTINRYAVLSDASSLIDTVNSYLRQDTTNLNIYNYNVAAAQEFLEVPANPVIGQQWNVPGSLVKKVTNLAADIHTTNCWYTHLLEITVFNGSTIISKCYYKKGFGLVYRIDPVSHKEFSVSSIHFI